MSQNLQKTSHARSIRLNVCYVAEWFVLNDTFSPKCGCVFITRFLLVNASSVKRFVTETVYSKQLYFIIKLKLLFSPVSPKKNKQLEEVGRNRADFTWKKLIFMRSLCQKLRTIQIGKATCGNHTHKMTSYNFLLRTHFEER
jgi:hypothetical protein